MTNVLADWQAAERSLDVSIEQLRTNEKKDGVGLYMDKRTPIQYFMSRILNTFHIETAHLHWQLNCHCPPCIDARAFYTLLCNIWEKIRRRKKRPFYSTGDRPYKRTAEMINEKCNKYTEYVTNAESHSSS